METKQQVEQDQNSVSDKRSVSAPSEDEEKLPVPETPEKQKEEEVSEVYEIFFGELSYDADEEDIRKHFEECGDIINIKLLTRMDGKSKGKGFIKLSSKEAQEKALDLHDSEMMGRRIVVEKPANPTVKKNGVYGNSGNAESKSVIVRNLPFRLEENDLYDVFEDCGKIRGCKIVKNMDGRSKGFGFVDFDSFEDAKAALDKDGVECQGRSLRVEFSMRSNKGGSGGYNNNRGRDSGYGNRGRDGGYRNDGYRNDGYRNDGYRNRRSNRDY